MNLPCKDLPLIELRQIYKRFGRNVVLDGLDLVVYASDALAVIGPSGTGKSTVLRIMCGLLMPDAGEIYILGKRVEPADILIGKHGLQMGIVFQNAALFDSLTVAENVGFYLLEHSRLPRKQILELVEAALEKVGLVGVSDRYPSELSGGQRKRVSFARAIIDDPTVTEKPYKLLLYDEPTAGLDPVASTVVEDLMTSLRTAENVCDSFVVVTHQHSTIRRTAQRLVLLYQGRIRYAGKVEEIDQSDDPFVQQFFSGSTDGPMQIVAKD
ncbi:MAG: ABC transporter ATP-binding protein [Pseudanabaenaceae cyanobacterium]